MKSGARKRRSPNGDNGEGKRRIILLLTKLTLENFGLFQGKQIFDLRPESEDGRSKPIILIGGKNGAGKTTLFEAIRLCLYGPNLGEYRFRKKGEYESYVSGHFHLIAGSPLHVSRAAVELEFEHSHLGVVDTYTVKRSWHRRKVGIKESLFVTKNNEEIKDLDTQQWQEFINELIPPGISRLFFFDGEKIQSLAQDDGTNIQLKDAFKSLLGLRIVDQLRTDLGIFVSRGIKNSKESDLHEQISEIAAEIERLEEEHSIKHQERAQKQSYCDQTLGKIERLELKLSSEGGSFASKRSELKARKTQLDHEIEAERSHIRELCSSILPFALTPKYCLLLKERIAEEEQYHQWKNTTAVTRQKIVEIEHTIGSRGFWKNSTLTSEQKRQIADQFSALVRKAFTPSPQFSNYVPVHNFSPIEQQKVSVWMNEALEIIPARLRNYSNRLETLVSERRSIEQAINRAPEDDLISPMIEELNGLHQEIGQYAEQLKQMDEEIRQIEWKLQECERRKESQLDNLRTLQDLSTQLSLATRVQAALKEYSGELQTAKLSEFRQVFLECFNRLLRKDEFIQDIEIDPEDFSILLYTKHGTPIRRNKLSEGEKQIYAVSMLWALTICSGRPLPFIIDTPLGRLDSEHRDRIVNEFFPNASHQMVILSTDTEIDQVYFQGLMPYVAKTYRLEFNEKENATKIVPGYFWTDNNKAEVTDGV
ncbi:DNA sulfur modification protein DndD [Methanoculleus sp.]|uniref:DNA sulfur modification protein DndD n=1 Tax=Methanoculleus sp. TaxID=90427 RepID=UPI001BD5A6F0